MDCWMWIVEELSPDRISTQFRLLAPRPRRARCQSKLRQTKNVWPPVFFDDALDRLNVNHISQNRITWTEHPAHFRRGSQFNAQLSTWNFIGGKQLEEHVIITKTSIQLSVFSNQNSPCKHCMYPLVRLSIVLQLKPCAIIRNVQLRRPCQRAIKFVRRLSLRYRIA